ncbi:MAG TPA: aldose 1-epimerase family protein [Candidatus Eisenbacteria bacterium]|nr:aldose 1-epimerase family protein [Candidatus Eisenbacteria bacterium]
MDDSIMVSPDQAAVLPPSGEQYEIRWRDQQAIITEVGGGIRTYEVAGRGILDGYALDEMCTFARGAALIPWPNRLQDGRYTFDGHDYQTPLTEPDRQNAIHGLTRWMNWQARQVDPSTMLMSLRLHPQEGYPFTLDLEIMYRLADGGLEVRTTGRNAGDRPLPYASGHHPYVTVGTDLVDDAILRIPARRFLEVDDRLIPSGRAPAVDGKPLDFRQPHPISDLHLDTAYAGLEPDPDGRVRIGLRHPSGRPALDLWMDAGYPYVMAFTGDSMASERRRRSLGLEPMTAAPNAFRSGLGLRTLQRGESFTSTWGITPAL